MVIFQLFHTQKCLLRNSTSTSLPSSPNPDGCDVYLAGAVPEHCLPNPTRQKTRQPPRTASSRPCKRVCCAVFAISGSTEDADSCVARVIQEELSQDLITKGLLSDWFSRDDEAAPQVPLRKKPNPRNVANAEKAEELERELERYDVSFVW